MTINKRALPKAIAFGVASTLLYVALFAYSGELAELARRARAGDRAWFIAPIVIAFVFSYVHGAFTGYFWDVLGLKPAQDRNGK